MRGLSLLGFVVEVAEGITGEGTVTTNHGRKGYRSQDAHQAWSCGVWNFGVLDFLDYLHL